MLEDTFDCSIFCSIDGFSKAISKLTAALSGYPYVEETTIPSIVCPSCGMVIPGYSEICLNPDCLMIVDYSSLILENLD